MASDYRLVHPSDPALSMTLTHVIDDSFAYEREEAVHLLLGRGRKLDQGTRWGITGTLELEFWNKADRNKLIALWETGDALLLYNAFGNVYQVSISEPDVKRVPGVGVQDFTTVTIKYFEVA